MFAPDLINSCAIARSPRSAAQCNAVIPSPWATLIDAFDVSNIAFTAARSPRIAAFASAGAALGTPISPAPDGAAPESTIVTSTLCGACAMRSSG